MRRTAKESGSNRARKKLLAKTKWYKKGGKEDLYSKGQERKSTWGHTKEKAQVKQLEHKTVIFVEQTPRGELAKRPRDKSGGKEWKLSQEPVPPSQSVGGCSLW